MLLGSHSRELLQKLMVTVRINFDSLTGIRSALRQLLIRGDEARPRALAAEDLIGRHLLPHPCQITSLYVLDVLGAKELLSVNTLHVVVSLATWGQSILTRLLLVLLALALLVPHMLKMLLLLLLLHDSEVLDRRALKLALLSVVEGCVSEIIQSGFGRLHEALISRLVIVGKGLHQRVLLHSCPAVLLVLERVVRHLVSDLDVNRWRVDLQTVTDL